MLTWAKAWLANPASNTAERRTLLIKIPPKSVCKQKFKTIERLN
jgi:hypothetical protein